MVDVAPEAVPVPVPTDQAPGNLFTDYNPQGAMGGLFAPAYIRGFAPSEQAVAAWQAANRPVTSAMVDQLRMPNLWQPPAKRILANGVYGSGVPASQSYSDARGLVDVNALRAAAQGGPYDIEARRAAIAARIAENERLQNPPTPPTPPRPGRDHNMKGDDTEGPTLQEQIDELNRRVIVPSYIY